MKGGEEGYWGLEERSFGEVWKGGKGRVGRGLGLGVERKGRGNLKGREGLETGRIEG